MNKWNHFAVFYEPKNISDSLKVQELLSNFIKKYRDEVDEDFNAPTETKENKRLLLLSLLCILY